MIDKIRAGIGDVLATIRDGASIAIGGFGRTGVPVDLIDALCERDVRDLHTRGDGRQGNHRAGGPPRPDRDAGSRRRASARRVRRPPDRDLLGALQVAENGDLANWLVPGGYPGVGGAMDLVAGARRVWIMMTHVDKQGNPKLLKRCTFPLTGAGVVDRVYTDLAVFEFAESVLTLRECAPGVTEEHIAALTEAAYTVDLWAQGEPA